MHGPTWLRTELPQPIARAWHLAGTGVARDGMHDSTTVELALRFVTGLQLASLVAEGQNVQRWLTSQYLRRLSLGNMVRLTCELRDAADKPFVAALRKWPPPSIDQRLRTLATRRNDLAHANKTQSSAARAKSEAELSVLAEEILVSLDWLRRVELMTVVDMRPATLPRVAGHLRIYRGKEPQPAPEPATWEGEPPLGHLFVAAADDTPRALLDVAPFILLVGSDELDPISLWTGVGERGDVMHERDGRRTYHPVPASNRVAFSRLSSGATTAEAPTRYEEPALEHPTLTGRPVRAPTARPSAAPARADAKVHAARRRGLVLGAAVLATGALTTIAIVVAGANGTPSDATSSHGAPLAPTGPGAGAAREHAPAPPDCKPPELAGRWVFDTTVLHANADKRSGLGVLGHYLLVTDRPVGCTFTSTLRKTGYTQGGVTRPVEQTDTPRLTASPSGASIAAHARLGTTVDDPYPAEIALRLARHGEHLVGLWRHEGADRERAGYSGALVGRREGSTHTPGDARCFHDCVHACHTGADPLDPATEPCLLACAPKLERCIR